jgi:APA family basic amino acid/polyamine antiporter
MAFFTPGVLDTLANLYAFGATSGYMLVFISLIRLRFVDPYTPRPYKVPLNVKWKRRDGDAVEIPLLGFLGFLGVGSIFLTVIITHEIGRVVGVAWILICLTYYLIFRRRNGLPLLGSVPHDWEKEQIEVLTNAEEFDSLEQYKQALIRRDRKLGVPSRWEEEAPGA